MNNLSHLYLHPSINQHKTVSDYVILPWGGAGGCSVKERWKQQQNVLLQAPLHPVIKLGLSQGFLRKHFLLLLSLSQ